MKYAWEECDIKAGRRISGRVRTPSTAAMIGYDPSKPSDVMWCLIALSDGAVFAKTFSKAALAAHLNNGGYRPDTIEPDETNPRGEPK